MVHNCQFYLQNSWIYKTFLYTHSYLARGKLEESLVFITNRPPPETLAVHLIIEIKAVPCVTPNTNIPLRVLTKADTSVTRLS